MSKQKLRWMVTLLAGSALVYAIFSAIPSSWRLPVLDDALPGAVGVQAATAPDHFQAGNQQGDEEGEVSEEELISNGEALYGENCATCHQAEGQGSGGYPALAGNSFVTAEDATQVIETIVNGRGSMPSFGDQLSSEEIASVASYVRNAWDNRAPVVQVSEVAALMGEEPAQQAESEPSTEQQPEEPSQEGAQQEEQTQEDPPASDEAQAEATPSTEAAGEIAPIQIRIEVIVVTPESSGQAAAPAASSEQEQAVDATPTPIPSSADAATGDSGDAASEETTPEESTPEEPAADEPASEEAQDTQGSENQASEDQATEEETESRAQQTTDSPDALAPIGSSLPPSGTLPGEPAIQLIKVAEGLVDPINVAYAPDGSGRVFVVERIGRIQIVQDGQLLEEPFLDISELVKIDFLEQGLLGLAFHPDYANNGRFFVYYSDYFMNGDSFLVEYQVSDDDPNVADPNSAKLLLRYDQPYRNHNGGKVAFGPDGYLYWSSGDGGLAGDSLRNSQNLENMLGKLLRIDVDVDENSPQPYAIPEDNPFMGKFMLSEQANDEAQDGDYIPEALPEIWAYGLRNPWQFSFDRETGDLYIADVGQAGWEEINFQPADSEGGINYGWPIMEASHCFPAEKDCGLLGELPVAEYANPDDGCSITGIGVYRGEEFPSLDGIYFTADYCSGRFWGLTQDDAGEWHFAELLHSSLVVAGAGEDEAGNLYVTTCTCQFGRDYDPYEDSNGQLWQIVAADQVPEGAETAPLRNGHGAQEEEPTEEGSTEEGSTEEDTQTEEDGQTEESQD